MTRCELTAGHILLWMIILLIKVETNYCWQLFISNDSSVDSWSTYQNKSYTIPLFQRRLLISRLDYNDFQLRKNFIGFKYQLQSSNDNVLKIQSEEDKANEALSDNLYVVQRKQNVLKRIFNEYSTDSLIELNATVSRNTSIETKWFIKGFHMNFTQFELKLILFYDDGNSTPTTLTRSLSILVAGPERLIDKLFYIVVPVFVTFISIFMGIIIDPNMIKKIIKEPKALIVGLISQYGLMPFLAAAIAKLFHYGPLYSLALFVIGCCPGSGASNQWTILFDGDVNLSAMMSFVSISSSFFLMPLYFYTLGSFYMSELKINVPFFILARTLTFIVVPYGIGIGISHWFPKARPFVTRIIKPLMICMVTFFVTFAFAVNWYAFKLTDMYTGLTAPLLPTIGYFLGGTLAWLSRLSWTQVRTIGIEAGMQNTGIAFMIIMYSFPQPYATQAVFIPMVVALLTPVPLCCLLILKNVIEKCRKKQATQRSPVADGKLIVSNDSTVPNSENVPKKNDEESEERQQL